MFPTPSPAFSSSRPPQACVNFYRDALLLEDFAMVNYTAVIKLLKKRDKIAGTADKSLFITEVMTGQPFAM